MIRFSFLWTLAVSYLRRCICPFPSYFHFEIIRFRLAVDFLSHLFVDGGSCGVFFDNFEHYYLIPLCLITFGFDFWLALFFCKPFWYIYHYVLFIFYLLFMNLSHSICHQLINFVSRLCKQKRNRNIMHYIFDFLNFLFSYSFVGFFRLKCRLNIINLP